MKPRKLYKIGEVLQYSNEMFREMFGIPRNEVFITRQTLHNYTQMGLVHFAERTDSGHRLYDEAVFNTLEKIRRYSFHHTLAEVKELLDKERAATAPPKP
jgi:DNA-binding transcriptional MerR regulator